MMLRRSKEFLSSLQTALRLNEDLQERILLNIGRQEARRSRSELCTGIRDAEFQIFSQFGEDGILQYLLGRVPIEDESFVEIGVESYDEANTRFLLLKDNWSGVIIDAGRAHLSSRRTRRLMWRHDLDAIQAFVTADNINSLLSENRREGDIGLLSIDIDGNDYWVLQAIDVVSPRVLVAEYNSLFGPSATVSVPYLPTASRFDRHVSGLLWGASISALTEVARAKGFSLVGSNSTGNNAFFVRDDVLGPLTPVEPSDAWVESRFREARGGDRELLFTSGHLAQRQLIRDCHLVDVADGTTIRVGDL